MSCVTGSSPAPTSAYDLLSIGSTAALPKGVYGSGPNTGVPGVSWICTSLCGVPPPPSSCRGRVFGRTVHFPSQADWRACCPFQ